MQAMSYRLLCIDEGRQRLALVDTENRAYGWTLDLADFPLARAMQRLDTDRALIGYDHGFFELEIQSGKMLRHCARWRNVSSVFREDDDTTRITGFDLNGDSAINVLTLDRDLRLRELASLNGDYVRLMGKTGDGSYLFCMNDHILETTNTFVPVRRLHAPGFEHAWMAARQPGGSTRISAGYGAFMASFNSAGELGYTFGHAAQLPPEVAPFFYASFQVLADRRILVANWQGHGSDNGEKGRQLLEFGPDGSFLRSWSDAQKISSLQGILLL